MEVTATTWTVENDTATASQTTFDSQRAFVDAEHNQYVWTSFERGLAEKFEEDAILHIPEWLAKEKGFPYTSEDRQGRTDWSGYAAVTLDEDKETDKALFIKHIRCSDTPILGGTNGLRRRRVNEWVPKSQITLYSLDEDPQASHECWSCGTPLFGVHDSVVDKATVRFTYNGARRQEYLCPNCAKSLAERDDAAENLAPCDKCGTLDVTCRPFLVTDGDGDGWRCADHRPEWIAERRELYATL